MDKQHLCRTIAVQTGVAEDVVDRILNSLEEVVVQVLKEGDQLHWGGFLRAWTVIKRPALPSSKLKYKDTNACMIRYRLPCCTFGGKVVQGFKKELFNAVDRRNHALANDE